MRINLISGKNLINFQSRNKKREDLRYQEAYRVLNDPLIQDSIAITLAQTMTQKQVCDKSIKVEDFIKNVLNLFAFNTKAQKTSNEIDDFIANTPNGALLVKRKSYDDFIKPEQKATTNNLDERINNFSKSHKINRNFVLNEATNTLKELPQEILDTLPDGIISYILKECSYEEKLFSEPTMTLEEKILFCKKVKKERNLDSWSVENNKKRLEKLIFARNLITNVSKIPSVFLKEDLKTIFEKNENGRYINQTSMKTFKNWLNSYPESTAQQGHYDILCNQLYNRFEE